MARSHNGLTREERERLAKGHKTPSPLLATVTKAPLATPPPLPSWRKCGQAVLAGLLALLLIYIAYTLAEPVLTFLNPMR